jgi:general stress protein CsbA
MVMQKSTNNNGSRLSANSYVSIGLVIILLAAAVAYGCLSAQVSAHSDALALVRTDYVSKDEYNATMTAVKETLKRIEDKVDKLNEKKER